MTFGSSLVACGAGQLTIASSGGGRLDAWIDFDADGVVDHPAEQVVVDQALGVSETLSVAVPCSAVAGTTHARFRLDSGGGLAPTGPADDGEVEDHLVAVGAAGSGPGSVEAGPGADFRGGGALPRDLQVGLYNYGNVPLDNLGILVDLGTGFADALSAELVSATSADLSVSPGFDGVVDLQVLDGSDLLPVGASGHVTLEVRVEPGDFAGPYPCSAVGSGQSPQSVEVTDVSQDGGDPDPDGDGDAGDDQEPSILFFPADPLEVPSLGQWGQILLVLLLIAVGLLRMRSRRELGFGKPETRKS